MMNNALKLALITCAVSFAGTTYHTTTTPEPLPKVTVEALTVEAVYEYAPPVTIEIVHDEVEINGLRDS